MLSKIPSDKDKELVKPVEVGNLPPVRSEVAAYYLNQAALLKKTDGPPIRCLATPWLLGNKGFFYIHVTIVGPVPKKPERYLPLSRADLQDILQAASDAVISLKEQALGEDTVS